MMSGLVVVIFFHLLFFCKIKLQIDICQFAEFFLTLKVYTPRSLNERKILLNKSIPCKTHKPKNTFKQIKVILYKYDVKIPFQRTTKISQICIGDLI